jgi:hypothetical protein
MHQIVLLEMERPVARTTSVPGSSGSLLSMRNNVTVRVAGGFGTAGNAVAKADTCFDHLGPNRGTGRRTNSVAVRPTVRGEIPERLMLTS